MAVAQAAQLPPIFEAKAAKRLAGQTGQERDDLMSDLGDRVVPKANPTVAGSAMCLVQDAGEEPGERDKKIAYAITYNRKCTCCGELDTSVDPVNPGEKRRWGYYRNSKCKKKVFGTEGQTCYYCVRAYQFIFNVALLFAHGSCNRKFGNYVQVQCEV